VTLSRREFFYLCSLAAANRGRVDGKAMPHESLREFIAPGHDAFPEEKIAMEIAAKLRAARPGRYYPLPENLVRFEISTGNEYRTGYYKMNWSAGDTTIRGVVDEQVATSPRPLFRDITADVFTGTPSFEEQMCRGIPYWRARLDSASGIDVYGNKGIAVGDIDNDGVDEIYVCQPAGLPNRLYKFKNGAMEDITERTRTGLLDDTSSALFVDLRNTGRQDLIVLLASGPVLLLNDNGESFRLRTDAFRFARAPQGSFTGMAAADYDRNGAVDLYLCCYVYFQSEAQYRYPVPYHDAQNGPPNFLFRNRLQKDGSGYLEDVTVASGLDHNNNRFSFAAAWCDYDGSGWPSVYVANDFGRNNLYKNDGGRFHDVGVEAGVEDIGPGMSASWFDYDGDGRFDLYVSNMWSDAGRRVTSSPAFKPTSAGPELVNAYRRHTKGNSLFHNSGQGRFEETGAHERVEIGRWAWASDAADFDNDGSPEIFITCGMLTNRSSEDAMSFFWRDVVANSPVTAKESVPYENGWNAINQFIREDYGWAAHEPNMFYARRDGKYVDCSGISGLDHADDSRAFSIIDIDGDGNLDLIVKNRLAPQLRVFQNDCGRDRKSIAFMLRGTKSNRDAIGAIVEVDGQVKAVQAGSGFLSQHTKRLYFGLGQAASAKRVKVRWPSGVAQDFHDLASGALYEIEEDSAETKRRPFAEPLRTATHSELRVDNEPRLHPTWFLEAVPLPVAVQQPGLFVVEQNDPVWSIFRRYLFDYRADLKPPMFLLINESGKARKIYADRPTAADVRADMRADRPAALPFPGTWALRPPGRDYFKLGAAFFWAGFPDQALPYLAEVVRKSPENERALMAIAQIHAEAGRMNEARDTTRALLASPARSADVAEQLGLVFAQKGVYQDARDLFQRAITVQRDNASAINNLAVLYLKMGQSNDAIAAFRYGIEVSPDSDMLYLNLGRLYAQMGDRGSARAVMQRLLDRKPGDATAERALRELETR
jgi:Flp pilus assembly protein TadD